MDEVSVYAAPYEVGVGRMGWMLVRQDQGQLERVAPVSDWLMAIEPGCSPNSLERWARSLSLWWRWCVDTDVDPLRPTAVIFSKYVTSLQTRAKRKMKGRGAPPLSGNVALLPGDKRLRSSSTVRQRVDDVKRFYAWTVEQGCFVPKANAQQIARYKSPKSSQVRTAPRLMPDEVKIMQATRWHPRDVLWRELFHGAGLRSGEGLGLVTEDMCVTAEVASVYGCWAFSRFGPHLHVRQREDHPRGARSKARMHEAKPRVVPLTTRTVMAYQDWQVWLFEHVPEAIESQYLLLSLGGSTRGRPWSYDGLKDRSNELFKRIPGLEATTPHLLRHTYASELADAGVDSMTIQELLGHRSAASTEIYTHRMAAALVEGVSKLSQWRENAIGAQ